MTCAFHVSHWFSLLAGQLSVQMNANSRFSCFILPLLLLRSRLPRNNNRGCVHQHSFMASHYAKRRAKGAWHFLPVGRKIRKNRLRLLFVFFFFGLQRCVSINAIIVLQSSWLVRWSNLVAIRKTRCISNCQEPSIWLEFMYRCQACIVYCQVFLLIRYVRFDISNVLTYYALWWATL